MVAVHLLEVGDSHFEQVATHRILGRVTAGGCGLRTHDAICQQGEQQEQVPGTGRIFLTYPE